MAESSVVVQTQPLRPEKLNTDVYNYNETEWARAGQSGPERARTALWWCYDRLESPVTLIQTEKLTIQDLALDKPLKVQPAV